MIKHLYIWVLLSLSINAVAQNKFGLEGGINLGFYKKVVIPIEIDEVFYDTQKISPLPGININVSNTTYINDFLSLVLKTGYLNQAFELKSTSQNILFENIEVIEHFVFLQSDLSFNIFQIADLQMQMSIGYAPQYFFKDIVRVGYVQQVGFRQTNTRVDHLLKTGLELFYQFKLIGVSTGIEYKIKTNSNSGSSYSIINFTVGVFYLYGY